MARFTHGKIQRRVQLLKSMAEKVFKDVEVKDEKRPSWLAHASARHDAAYATRTDSAMILRQDVQPLASCADLQIYPDCWSSGPRQQPLASITSPGGLRHCFSKRTESKPKSFKRGQWVHHRRSRRGERNAFNDGKDQLVFLDMINTLLNVNGTPILCSPNLMRSSTLNEIQSRGHDEPQHDVDS